MHDRIDEWQMDASSRGGGGRPFPGPSPFVARGAKWLMAYFGGRQAYLGQVVGVGGRTDVAGLRSGILEPAESLLDA